MISFSKFGEYGRLGNQLFQYSFLRTQAKRLGVRFFCPSWVGEKIFLLNDNNEKTSRFEALYVYNEDPYQHGYSDKINSIQAKTDIAGYFQSYEFFEQEDVMSWFTFNKAVFTEVTLKYSAVDFSSSVAIHVRLGDYTQGSLMFYTPTPDYFKQALKLLGGKKAIIFSEDATAVKKYLGDMPDDTIYIEGNKDYEDFYLMTLCKDIIISPSSFSWWAAYLNKNPTKRVVLPKYWYIPFSRVKNNGMAMKNWIKLKGHRIIADNYYYRYISLRLAK